MPLTVGKERTEAREEAFFDLFELAFVPERGGKTEFVEGFPFFVGDGEGKFAVRTFERPTEGDGGEIGGVFEWDGVKGEKEGKERERQSSFKVFCHWAKEREARDKTTHPTPISRILICLMRSEPLRLPSLKGFYRFTLKVKGLENWEIETGQFVPPMHQRRKRQQPAPASSSTTSLP